jgi:hypothetical protein
MGLFKKLMLSCALFALVSCSVRKQTAASGWTRLFNGKELNDWIVKIKDHPLNENWGNTFRVEEGVLKVRYDAYENFNRQYGHIYYKQPFSYYLLVMEYRFVGEQAKGGEGWALRNSGAMLHCQPPQTIAVEQDFPISLEMQLLGGNGNDPRTTANLCTPGTNVVLNNELFTPHCVNSTSKTYPGDQWVRAEALVLGDSLMQHIVEGDTVISYRQPQYDANDGWVKKAGYQGGDLISGGYISLQSESHPVEFRKVVLFNLEPYKANPEKLRQVLKQLQERKGEE